MTSRNLVLLAVALWLLGLSYLSGAQESKEPPAKVDVVAVAGSPWTGVLTVVLPIVFTGAVTIIGLWFKHAADMRQMQQLHAEMAADRATAEAARQTVERRADEDRAHVRRIADEDRAEQRRVAQRVERVAIDLTKTNAITSAAATETREQLTSLAGAVQAQNVVAQQTGEVLASVHAFLNSGKTMTLQKNAEAARTKANASGDKVDIDAAELAERDLADQLARQLIADTQGGKGQEAGSASIQAASEALAGSKSKEEASAVTTAATTKGVVP